jgi:hypothetical protein
MSIDKMDSSAVYALFEELKQKIVELGNKQTQSVQPESAIDSTEITVLTEQLQNLINQKQFTPEQIKELQENMAEFAGCAVGKAFEKSDKDFAAISELIKQIDEKLALVNVPANFVIRKEHAFSIDFKNSKAAITMISMGLVILLSLGGNIWQANRNSQLKDNDLKYRYIKMQGAANLESLYGLENIFTYNRDSDSISVIRKRVETYERLVKEQVEKIERARMNAKEAERLQKEVESVKSK